MEYLKIELVKHLMLIKQTRRAWKKYNQDVVVK